MKITASEESADFATLDTENLFNKLKSYELFSTISYLVIPVIAHFY
jgi:hypothetical protein